MKIQLCVVGKTSTPYILTGIETYMARLRHYIPLEIKTIADIRNTRRLTEEQQRVAESEQLLASVQPGDFVILLDERGREYTSREFSQMIEKRMASVSRNIVFMVGGPYGFSQAVYDRADDKISLSRMTFSHEMARLFFVEQLYRAMTILRGEPYHHD